jgi:hypothetical protein
MSLTEFVDWVTVVEKHPAIPSAKDSPGRCLQVAGGTKAENMESPGP